MPHNPPPQLSTPQYLIKNMNTKTNNFNPIVIEKKKKKIIPIVVVLLILIILFILKPANIYKILFIVIAYFEKFLYISNFSFLCLPIIIIIPSLLTSIYLSIEFFKTKKITLLFICFFFWFFLLIFIIRTSAQRYLFPLIPVTTLFFICYLILSIKNEKNFKKYQISCILISMIYIIFSIIYQNSEYLRYLFNIFSSIVLLILYIFLLLKTKYQTFVSSLIIFLIIFFSVGLNLYSFFTKNQLYSSQIWGINGEAKKIATFFKKDDTIFIDCKTETESEWTYLLYFYRKDMSLKPEWTWKLKNNVPKKKLLKIPETPNTYYFPIKDIASFKEDIMAKKINKIVLFQSTLLNKNFPLENYIEILKQKNWVELSQTIHLKNKIMYVFIVKNENK